MGTSQWWYANTRLNQSPKLQPSVTQQQTFAFYRLRLSQNYPHSVSIVSLFALPVSICQHCLFACFLTFVSSMMYVSYNIWWPRAKDKEWIRSLANPLRSQAYWIVVWLRRGGTQESLQGIASQLNQLTHIDADKGNAFYWDFFLIR